MKAFFLKENSSFAEHLDQQRRRYDLYLPVLVQLLGHGVDLQQTTKSKILAAAWARADAWWEANARSAGLSDD